MKLKRFLEFVDNNKYVVNINEEYYATDPETQLIEAAKKGKVSAIKSLVDQGTDINFTNDYGNTSLTMSIYFKNINSIEALISSGADVNKPTADKSPKMPLDIAIENGYDEIIEILKSNGAVTMDEFNNDDIDDNIDDDIDDEIEN